MSKQEIYFKVLIRDSSGIYVRGYTTDPKKWIATDLKEGWYQKGQPEYTVSFEVIVKHE